MRKLGFLLAFLVFTMSASDMAASNDEASVLNSLAGYRQWTRVTPEPVKVEVPLVTATLQPVNLASVAL
ncbi:MAG TPA: hypothetical protein VKD91_05550 [Pyrinomonadaceae bacterium]|nr:hypothetical protein [Pyrinomonadaceae bacterium]